MWAAIEVPREICGTTHKTVRRIIEAHETGQRLAGQARGRNFDQVRDLVVLRVEKTLGRISAKRLLPQAQAAGYAGSARNFRRLVAQTKAEWRRGQHRGRRPGVWAPGETLIIDWGMQAGVHVFCAVLAWSRFRFVRFADNEKATTTFGLLAECFEQLGGVPKTVLADRMGCLKSGWSRRVVVPTPDYVRFATHYGFRPDFCEAADPESKGMVEHLVGYAKQDLMVPQQPFDDLTTANEAAALWCAEVNTITHLRDLRRPDRTAGRGAAAARPAAVVAARAGCPAGQPEGRPVVVCPIRVGPLLGAVPADRPPGHHHHHQLDDHDRRACHR